MMRLKDTWNRITGRTEAELRKTVSALQDNVETLRGEVELRSTKWFGNGDVQVTSSGKGYTSTSAMKLAAVYRCISIVSGTVASLPLQILRKTDGYWQTEDTGRLAMLLSLRPNPRQTAFDLVRNAVIQILMSGNAYIYPEWSESGRINRIVLLSPGTCTYEKEQNIYRANDFTNRVFGTFDADEMIHLRNLSVDGGYTGVSTLSYAAKVLRIAAKSDDKSEEVYSPGGTRRGFITGDNSFTKGVGLYQDAEVKNAADRIEGEVNSGKRVMNMPGGLDFKPLDFSPADTELIRNKEFGVLEICRFFGVHPDKVFAGQSTNYKASEMSQVLFMSDTLQQILKQFSLEFTAKLFVPSQYGRYRIGFSVEDFYSTDLMTLASFTEKNIATGVWTINEARRRRGYAPVPGGDDVLISANLLHVEYKKGDASGEKSIVK